MIDRKTPNQLPAIGIGTHTLKGDACTHAVKTALEEGYRHIDTASNYQNETQVRDAIHAAEIPRHELFLTTKATPKEMKTAASLTAALDESLKRLGTDYVDCYMLHWPAVNGLAPGHAKHHDARAVAWATLDALRRSGKCRHIAVSNFLPRHLDSLPPLEAEGPMWMHQLELHPWCWQRDACQATRSRGGIIQQYSPLAKQDSTVYNAEALEILGNAATALNELHSDAWTASNVSLAWGLATGRADCLVVRSTNREHLARNRKLAERAARWRREAEEATKGGKRQRSACGRSVDNDGDDDEETNDVLPSVAEQSIVVLEEMGVKLWSLAGKDVHTCWHSDLVQ